VTLRLKSLKDDHVTLCFFFLDFLLLSSTIVPTFLLETWGYNLSRAKGV